MDCTDWYNFNREYLRDALDRLAEQLQLLNENKIAKNKIAKNKIAKSNLECKNKNYTPALMQLSEDFELSAFEYQLVLLCAGVQLDRTFGEVCTEFHGDKNKPWVSFDLAVQLFNQGEWLPFTAQSTLRYWHILELDEPRAVNLSPLRLDDTVLHYLTGHPVSDPSIESYLLPQTIETHLVNSHQAVGDQIKQIFTQSRAGSNPIILLDGTEHAAKPIVTTSAMTALGLQLHRIDTQVLPRETQALHTLYKRMEREAILHRCAFLFEGDIESHIQDSIKSLSYLLKRLSAPCLVTSNVSLSHLDRDVIKLEIKRPIYQEQKQLWQSALNGSAQSELLQNLPRVLDQFDLGAQQISSIAHQWHSEQTREKIDGTAKLWSLCRQQARHKIIGLARIIEPVSGDELWNSLVLPEEAMQTMRAIIKQVKQRHQVYQQWGFARQSSYGLGISALFAGGSGTGKTLAARAIGSELDLDVYHIDLSAMVSKYIGETEKNLESIFSTAQSSGAILLFDEADALFGKRSQVNDSKDRYANMEVSYLLQRMESYAGLSILTTNFRTNLDEAFVRRLRFIVQFQFPQGAEREAIWRSVFPQSAPKNEIDFKKLARLEITGGLIRSIAVNAAFHAANDECGISMHHIKLAVADEFSKTEKTLLPELVADW